MKFGLQVYDDSRFELINIGDYIQSIAARQFLPQVDELIARDRMNGYEGEKIKLIMNGWFTHHPENWPPAENIEPLFVSFHLNKRVAKEMLESDKIVSYLRSHEPIGCRDFDSTRRMQAAGIDAYYSGCLTTTLNFDGKLLDTHAEKKDTILMADVLFKDDIRARAQRSKLLLAKDTLTGKIMKYNAVRNYIASLVSEPYKEQIDYLTCYFDANTSEEQRFNHAESILRQLSEARVVVTSRIHIALPCLALGTPVLFAFGGKLSSLAEFRRLDGIINHMNVLVKDDFNDTADHLKGINFYRSHEIDWGRPPANPGTHLSFRDALVRRCQDFVKG